MAAATRKGQHVLCLLSCLLVAAMAQQDIRPAYQDDDLLQQPTPSLPEDHHQNNNNHHHHNHHMPNLTTTTPAPSPPAPHSHHNHHHNNNLDVDDSRGHGDDFSPPDDSSRRHHRRRNRRCKCLKRFMKEVDQLLDERLEDFEHKYLRQVNVEKERALALQNEASSTASRIQGLDKMMLALNTDLMQTKETLALMTTNLEVLRFEMNHTRGDLRFLNESFKALDGSVESLNRFVSRVERMIPSGLTRPGQGPEVEDDPKQSYPRNCDEVYRQGGMQFQGDYYIMIKPDGVARPFKVLCKIFNNSGWTVIQKRQDGSVDFFRTWQEYRKGFGSLEGEFWLGNDYIHHLSVQEPTTLRIELTDWEDRTYHAEYDSFRIDNEKGLYRLHIGNYHGDAGDSLRSHWENHDGMPFSTKDRDNDGRYYDSCAEHFHGAWWFNNCFDSHLNGKYYHKGFHKNYFQRDGIQWNTIHMYSSLKSVYMMVRPSSPSPSAPSAGPKRPGGKRNKRGRSRGKGRRASRKDRKKD